MNRWNTLHHMRGFLILGLTQGFSGLGSAMADDALADFSRGRNIANLEQPETKM